MVKTVAKYLVNGVSWGCAFFVIINILGVAAVGDSFLAPIRNDFVRQALGAIAVGLCSGSTSIIYRCRKLPFWLQTTIHACLALSGYFIVAYHLKWIPLSNYKAIIGFILCGILLFFGIWCGFYFYNKQEVKRINQRLQEFRELRNHL